MCQPDFVRFSQRKPCQELARKGGLDTPGTPNSSATGTEPASGIEVHQVDLLGTKAGNDHTTIIQWSCNDHIMIWDLDFGELWWRNPLVNCILCYPVTMSCHVNHLRISLSESPLWTCIRLVLLTGQMAGFCSWRQLCVSALSALSPLSLSLADFLFKQHWLEVSKVEADFGKVQSNISEIMGLPVCTSHVGYQHAWHSEAFQILCLNIFMILLYSGSSHQIILKKRVSFEQLVHAVEAGTSSGSLWGLWRFRFLSHFLLHRRTYLRVLHQRAVDRRRAHWCSKDWLVHTHRKIHSDIARSVMGAPEALVSVLVLRTKGFIISIITIITKSLLSLNTFSSSCSTQVFFEW